jgi:hypothetical protein
VNRLEDMVANKGDWGKQRPGDYLALLAVALAALPMFEREPLVQHFHPLMGVQHFICPFCYADEQVYSDPFPHSKRCSWLRTKAAIAPLLEDASD